ncbi:MAG: hypothetical protein JNL32_15460, partial [Candidatus Kapabacteria bacterium]|nr:hypothetical protein [Candidatus Kapabacteria bacterium]
GCTATSTQTITITVTTGITVTASVQGGGTSVSVCSTATTRPTLTSSINGCGSSTGTYQWLRNGSTISGATNATYSIPSGLSVGTYQYSVIAHCGGCRDTSSAVTVTVTAAPDSRIALQGNTSATSVTYCQGATGGVLIVTQPTSGITGYQWLLAGQPISGATNATFTIPTTATGSFLYCVRVTVGGCSDVSNEFPVTITSAPNPNISIVNGGSTTTLSWCFGNPVTPGNIGQPCLQTGSFSSYQWTVNGTDISGATSNPYVIPWTTLQPGTYVYRVRVTQNGCTATSTQTITITVGAKPDATIQASFTSFCSGSSNRPQLTTAGGAFATYQWQVNGSNVASNGTSMNYDVPAGLTAGTYNYRVIVTNNAGCRDTSNSVAITVTSGVNATITGGGTVCSGGTQNVTFTLTSGSTSSWTLVYREQPAGGSPIDRSVGIQNSATHTISVAPSVNTTYSIVSVTAGGCSASPSGSVSVTVQQTPAPQTINSEDGSPNSACYGQTKVYTVPNNTSGNTFTWSVICNYTGVTTQQLSNTRYQVTFPASISGNPEYCATIRVVERTSAGCERVNTICTTVRPKPNAITPTVSSSTACSGQSVNIQIANSQSGVTYRVFNGTTQVGTAQSGPGNLAWAVTPTGTTTYTVRGTNASGCETTMGSVTVNTAAAPTVAISTPSANICPGQQAAVNFTFTGQGPWTLVYRIGSGSNTTVQTSSNPFT